MWHSVILLLQRQRGKSILVSGGFLLTAFVLVLLSAATNTLVVQGTQTISQNWRPTYDLVVVPSQSALTDQQLVPSDVLAGSPGGISLTQYAQIKTLPGIAVAAPIAYVGYFDLPTTTVHTDEASMQPGFYKEEWVQTSFNGQHRIVEQHFTYYLFIDDSKDCHFTVKDADAVGRHTELQMAYEKQGIIYDCAPYSTDASPYDHNISRAGLHTSPIVEKYLLAAIDPDVENQLVHLDKSITQGRMLTEQDTAQQISGGNINGQLPPLFQIPLLIHGQLPDHTTTHLNYTRLSIGNLTPEQIMNQGGVQYLKSRQPQQQFINQDIPAPTDSAALFSSINLDWDGHTWSSSTSGGQVSNAFLSGLSQPAGLTYQPVTGPKGSTDPAYIVTPVGVEGPEVTFRNLKTLGAIKTSTGYFDQPVGQFSDATMAAQFDNPLNWLPESTYAVPPDILRYDAQGKPVAPTTLLPTANTAGYVIQSPLALTTLKAAQQLLGDRFINAIRVKVSGVEQANEQSWKRIQQVAAEIEEKTHLHVLVTLGSSPHPVVVYVPGLKQGQLGATQDIAPVGWVEEHWIAIGAGIRFLQELGLLRILLLGAILGVCLCYFQTSFSALESAQRREFAILSALGWRPWQPALLFFLEALLLGLIGGTIGLFLGLLTTLFLQASPLWPVIFAAIPTMLVLAILSALVPFRRLLRLQSAQGLQAGVEPPAVRQGKERRGGSGSSSLSLGALVRHNLTRARLRAFITGGTLFFSAILLIVMLNSMLSLREQFSGTLLGNFILIQTVLPQIAGCLVAVLMAFLSVTDLLLLQVQERRREIGLLQAVGWHMRHVQRLFVQEGMLLAVVSTLPGVLIAEALLWFLQPARQALLPVFLVASAVLVFLLLVAILASLPAIAALRRMPITMTLQAG